VRPTTSKNFSHKVELSYMSKKQSLKFRLIVYPLLGVIFAIFAYFIAISAMGYKVSYINGKIKKERTGAIILSSRPGDAQILINNLKYTSKTPMFSFLTVQIGSLKPADYNVKIVKAGYETWDGAFRVYSGMVTWGTQILLLPQKRDAVAYNMSPTIESQLVSADKTKMIIVTSDATNSAMAVWQINTTSKNRQNLFEKRLAAGEQYRPIQYSSDNQRILFEHTLAEKKTYVVYEAVQNPASWEITNTFKSDFDSYLFNPRNHEEIITTRTGDMFRLNYVSKVMSGSLASAVKGTYLENQNILFIQKTEKYNSMYRLAQDNTKALVIRDLTESDTYAVSYLSSDFGYAVLPTKTKDLYIYKTSGNPDVLPKKVADSVDYILPSAKYQFLGYGRAGGFYTYELAKDRYFTVFENRKISSIAWFNDQFNLSYIENGKLKMITYNGSYDKDIFEASDSYQVVTSPDGPRLFFVAENKEKKIPDLFVFDFNS
jgi:hypothetical protein